MDSSAAASGRFARSLDISRSSLFCSSTESDSWFIRDSASASAASTAASESKPTALFASRTLRSIALSSLTLAYKGSHAADAALIAADVSLARSRTFARCVLAWSLAWFDERTRASRAAISASSAAIRVEGLVEGSPAASAAPWSSGGFGTLTIHNWRLGRGRKETFAAVPVVVPTGAKVDVEPPNPPV